MNLLVVCTANQCRSPMGEVLLRSALQNNGVSVSVGSAGLLQGGEPAVDNAQLAVKELGLDLSGHVSRRIDKEIINDADLILTMERMHVREIATKDVSAFHRTFTLKEFIRRAQTTKTRNHDLNGLLEEISKERKPSALMGSDASDEVADPLGQSLDAFRNTRDELKTAMTLMARFVG